jgi:hypothetical protein
VRTAGLVVDDAPARAEPMAPGTLSPLTVNAAMVAAVKQAGAADRL